MKFFRTNSTERLSLLKALVFGVIILSIVISFVWQMSLGFCPVP